MSEDVAGRPRGHLAARRASSFGAQAERYDRIRPGYPDTLAEALCAGRRLSVLDVGCGTGKSARPFLAACCRVLGLEPDPKMAELARRAGLEVLEARFEEWEADGSYFDLVVSGQAWHWVDPAVGAAKAAEVLEEGGCLAPFWNYRRLATESYALLEPIYRSLAPALLENSPLLGSVDPDEELGRYGATITDCGRFGPVSTHTFPWTERYQSADWLDLTRTQSDHLLLGEEAVTALLEALAEELGEMGSVVVHYTSAVLVATRR